MQENRFKVDALFGHPPEPVGDFVVVFVCGILLGFAIYIAHVPMMFHLINLFKSNLLKSKKYIER